MPEQHGIAVAADLPAVGRALQDHLHITHVYRSRVPTLNDTLGSWTGQLRSVLRFAASRRGPLSMGVNQAGGFVSAAHGAGPPEPPRIVPNYLSPGQDIAQALASARMLRPLAVTRPLRDVIEAEILPGRGCRSDDALLQDFRARADTIFHPVGTCAMGPDASSSVVDSRLRVHGVTGLRAIDASVFPRITSANTNAPTVMVAEKGAQMVLEDLAL